MTDQPCVLCGVRPASSGGLCPACDHGIGPNVCVERHNMLNHTPVPTDLLERAQAGRNEMKLLELPNWRERL